MKAKPILFSTPMIQALLEGRKTQTRRVIKSLDGIDQRSLGVNESCQANFTIVYQGGGNGSQALKCPYGKIGDLLWVRETFADVNDHGCPAILYKADHSTYDFMTSSEEYLCDDLSLDYSHPHIKKYDYSQWIYDVESGEEGHGYRPSIFMPKWASRLTLEITDIRVERLHSISDRDAFKEGVELCYDLLEPHEEGASEKYIYLKLWDKLNGKESTDSNPFVWVLEFKVHKCNFQEILKNNVKAGAA